MIRLNSRQWLVMVGTLVTVLVLVASANRRYSYSLADVTNMIGSLELGGTGDANDSMFKAKAFITDNNSPDIVVKHEIENKVNELLKEKLAVELELERDDMKKQLDEMRKKVKEAELTAQKAVKEKDSLVGLIQVDKRNIDQGDGASKFLKSVYSFRTASDETGKRVYDADENELVLLSSFTSTFGRNRNYEDFLVLLDGIKDVPHPKTSISFLIGDHEVFKKLNKYVDGVFNNIKSSKSAEELSESFSRITLLYAPFLEEQLDLQRSERQKTSVQKHRRRVLAEMRNFLLMHGIVNEKYSLFIDSDVIELPKNMLKTFIESNADIATVRIDMKSPQGQTIHPDYDLNAWAGSRIKPNEEQEKKLDEDPEFLFEPRPAGDAIHMLDLSNNKEKFGLDNSISAKYELKSVGGAILFAKCDVYRRGATFPPYYIIGTKWERGEGWDGIETEGLCYIANAIGFKCWGFPNMIGYHTT